MITKKQAYQYILNTWIEYSSIRLDFATEIVGFGCSDKSEHYLTDAHDSLFNNLFDNCIIIEDGEAAFSKQELEEIWQEIEVAIEKIRQWLKENS